MKTQLVLLLAALGITSSWPAHAVVSDQAQADLILGRPLPNATNMVAPRVAVDPATQKVFVSDERCHRILRFGATAALTNGAAAEAVLGQPDFTSFEPGTAANRLRGPAGMWCDTAGRLWVADAGNNRVLRFDNAVTLTNGAPANGVLGQVNFVNNTADTTASTLSYPNGLVTDSFGYLYVADTGNHRVLRFNNAVALPNGASASAVLGQPDFSSGDFATSQFISPRSVAISPNPVLVTQPYLWVADSGNDRVLRYNDAPHLGNGAAASRVLGQPDFTSRDVQYNVSGTHGAMSVATDGNGRLYVGCLLGNVRRFDNAISKTNFAPADGLLGNTDFTSRDSGNGPAQLNYPYSLAVGAGGRLWIGDYYNNRVIRHEAAHTKVNGADADGVLGEASTTRDMTRTFRPRGLALCPVSGKLFIADDFRHRVLRFASIAALQSGAGAEAVFGQPDMAGAASGTAANRLKSPASLVVDALGNLYVSDYGNHRVLRFNNAWQRSTGVAADGVLGQANFYSGDWLPWSASSLNAPQALAIGPGGHLWVANSYRVSRFNLPHTKPNGAPADGVLGQLNFTNNVLADDAAHFGAFGGVTADSAGRLWVSDPSRRRVLRFNAAAAKTNGAPADGVLGQADFTSTGDNGLGPDGFSYAELCVEPNGRLWLADAQHHRVLRWENAATRANGADADGLFGQPDFGFGASGAGLGQFYGPSGILCDPSGNLWVADFNNERVLRFPNTLPRLKLTLKNPTTVTLTCEGLAKGAWYSRHFSTNLVDWNSEGSFRAPAATETIDRATTGLPAVYFRMLEQ